MVVRFVNIGLIVVITTNRLFKQMVCMINVHVLTILHVFFFSFLFFVSRRRIYISAASLVF